MRLQLYHLYSADDVLTHFVMQFYNFTFSKGISAMLPTVTDAIEEEISTRLLPKFKLIVYLGQAANACC